MILDSFEYDVGTVSIHLEELSMGAGRSSVFVVSPRWGGTDVVNGYEYRINNIAGISLEKASRLTAIREMAENIKRTVQSDLWTSYEREIFTDKFGSDLKFNNVG